MQTTDDHILFRDEVTGRKVLFDNPSELLIANSPSELDQLIADAESHHRDGRWLAGYFSYEAGMDFEKKLKPLMPDDRRVPLACMGVFESPSEGEISENSNENEVAYFGEPVPDWSYQTYVQKFEQLTHHMMMGDCYQGNLTFGMNCEWTGSPLELFNRLKDIQPVGHAVFVHLGGSVIFVSFSGVVF